MSRLTKFLLIAIIVAATWVRFDQFLERIHFGPEQAFSLLWSADYLNVKWSLLGIENFQRATSDGHLLYSGSLFNYSLVPLLLIFDFRPDLITAYFALLNIFTGWVIFVLARKMFGFKIAVFAAVIFLFNFTMIYHSHFIWILNYLPLVGMLSVYALYGFRKSSGSYRWVVALGVLAGIGFNLEYMYLFTAGLIFFIMLKLSRKKFLHGVLFVLGAAVANAPMIVFDLKHDFYHFWTLWQYFLDTVVNPEQSRLAYYHFLQFWPLMAIFAAWILTRIWSRSKFIAIAVLVFYVFTSSVQTQAPFVKYQELVSAAGLVAKDNPENFNVASNVPFDSARAYPLRYLVTYLFDKKPKGVEEYEQVEAVYALTRLDHQFLPSDPWEFTARHPQRQLLLGKVNEQIGVFKLVK